jgi:hypothetical protein
MNRPSVAKLAQTDISTIVAIESGVLESLDGYDTTETMYICPLYGGTAHLVLHEWLGYISYCVNRCFTADTF